jgi:prolipoprotein diacylglyceryl transferase
VTCAADDDEVEHSLLDGANRLLDTLPRPYFTRGGRRVSVFLTCGVTGFYIAVVVLLAAGLATGRSLLVLALLALSSGLSFFAYTWLRRALTGAEELVLLEHVWFALGVDALVLALLREPLLPYLGLVALAMCPFLAAGRVGCFLVGCCHGLPSGFGVRYDPACAAAGFPWYLVGVRLFPLSLVEGVGLMLIGVTGAAMAVIAGPAGSFVWFVLAYGVLRFGLEGLRGDRRPHLLGLSEARWICLVQVVVAVLALSWPVRRQQLAVAAALGVVLVAAILVRRALDPRRRLLAAAHVHELQEVVRAARAVDGTVWAASTRLGATLAVSPAYGRTRHVSLSLGEGRVDAEVLCRLAIGVLPRLHPESGVLTGHVLHVLVDGLDADATAAGGSAARGDALYGHVLRRLQNCKSSRRGLAATPDGAFR